MINYTFIIPHRNTPDLLYRCLNSIPQRNDIQIIVVDDNSEAEKKPHIFRSDVKIIFLGQSESKGAGHARNVGLREASGRWLLFADADDYYVDGFIEYLDNYINSDIEVLYFGADSVDSNTLKQANRTNNLNEILKRYVDNGCNLDEVKYKVKAPWFKMVRYEFVKKHDIKFEEIIKGNDILFTYLIGFCSSKFHVTDKILYVCTYSCNSMTYTKYNKSVFICSIKNTFHNNSFYKYIGHKDWCISHFRIVLSALKKEGLITFVKVVIAYVINLKDFIEDRDKFIKLIEKKNER